jgi:hypothetical protein
MGAGLQLNKEQKQDRRQKKKKKVPTRNTASSTETGHGIRGISVT